MDVPMELLGVRVEIPDNTPVMLLREQGDRQRLLPILIGNPEASSIHLALGGVVSPRPLTHDLFVEVLQTLGITVDRVVITDIREHTYYATLYLQTADGMKLVSSRPSDAVALATRTGSPIFATQVLLDEVGQDPVVADDALTVDGEEEQILDEFRDFIDSINPEDFRG